MNNNNDVEDIRVFEDAWLLMKHISQLPIWESDNVSEMVKIGRERLQCRRKMEIRRLGNNIRFAFSLHMINLCV